MLHWLIDDEEMKLALREYLAPAGERITGQSVAYAISSYWQTGILSFEKQLELKDPLAWYAPETKAKLAELAQERQNVQDTLSSHTVVKWLHKICYKLHDIRKGVYKDGHEWADGIEYRQ